MKTSISRIVVLVFVALLITSCFSTKQSCGFAQTNNIKKENSKTLYKESVMLKKQVFVLVANAK